MDCYIGYAQNIDCIDGVKKGALLRDDLEMRIIELTAERAANPAACGNPETLKRWLETAPAFPARKSSQPAGS
jgi:hypothetical protein